MDKDTEILQFLKEYPVFAYNQALAIYEYAEEKGIPQCSCCWDWHFPDEECSAV